LNIKLQYRFDELEHDRIKLLDKLSKLPEEKLERKSSPEHWSINQILIHLLTAEQLTLTYLRKKSLGIDQLANAGPIESLKMTLLKISQRLPLLKYKAPNVVVQNTPDVVPLPELMDRWNLSRADLGNFLETIEDKNIHKLIYRHPIAGRFDVVQCLAFLREHVHHHLPQIKRLL
jgi:hypothetical protein